MQLLVNDFKNLEEMDDFLENANYQNWHQRKQSTWIAIMVEELWKWQLWLSK